MANLTNGKVIDEIVLDDGEEMENSSDSSNAKEHFNSGSSEMNDYPVEQGRADKGFENGDDDEEMDYDEISHVNQPVDFIFAVEDDDGVETEFDTQKIFSSELNENKLTKNESPVETTPQVKSLIQSSSAKIDQPIRTRSALRQQSNSQNGYSHPTSTPTTTNGIKKKVKAPGTVETIPSKQLRSSARETRNVQNKTTQPTPAEPKTANKKVTNTPINTNHSTQPTPNEPKSVNKKITTNNINSVSNVGTKSGKKSVTSNKVVTNTPNTSSTVNRAAITTNGKQNGNSKMNKNSTNSINSTETPTTDRKTAVPKKRTKSYWNGKEHVKLLGPDSPYVMVERLSLFLSGQTEYKGHDCLTSVCPAKRTMRKAKSPLPPPRIEPLVDNSSLTIDSVVNDIHSNLAIPPGRPQIGQTIRFQFWQTPLGNNVPAKSSFQKARIIGYDEEYDLYEIKLFHYDHPFIITKDKSKNRRIASNTMIIDWDSLADSSIL